MLGVALGLLLCHTAGFRTLHAKPWRIRNGCRTWYTVEPTHQQVVGVWDAWERCLAVVRTQCTMTSLGQGLKKA